MRTHVLLSCAAMLLLSACASHRPATSSAPRTDQSQSYEGSYKIGNPYQINGIWYYPHEDYSYDEAGVASWYGTEFSGAARTANGELFNKDELTAAHKTLPLPSLARVTNLENGRSIVVRINDRGPFCGNRIIDLSQRSAQLLGFENIGTAKVRVQVLADESRAIADAMRRYGNPPAESIAQQQQIVQAMNNQPQPTRIADVEPLPIVHQVSVQGANQLYVQAGSFSSLDNAKRTQQQLSSLGNVRITEALVNGVKFYRVRMGPVQTVPLADALLKKVGHKTGVSGAKIVVE